MQNADGHWFTITGDFHKKNKKGKNGKKNQRYLNLRFDSGYECTSHSIKSYLLDTTDLGSPTLAGVGVTHGIKSSVLGVKTWRSMILRCYYDQSSSTKYYKEKGITVCERWHYLQLFLKDLPKLPNYELWAKNPQKYTLDKDFLVKNNKIYSPETCSFQDASNQGRYAGRKKGVSGVRGIQWNTKTQSWDVVVDYIKVAIDVPHINEALLYLLHHLKLHPDLPQSRFGVFYDGIE